MKNLETMIENILEKLEEAEKRDDVMLRKIESIQEKLQELSAGQLEAILTQASNIAKEMANSNDYTSMMINAKALTDTVEIDKDELKILISDAFVGNDELKEQMKNGFTAVRKGAQLFYDSLSKDLATHDSNYANGVETILEVLSNANATLSSVNNYASNIQQRVNAIPTSGGLM